MNRELIVVSTECKPCTAIGKNLKFVIPKNQFRPHIPCPEPNQEKQIDFRGPIYDEKDHEVYFLAAIYRFSKIPTASIFNKANGPFQVKNFCNKKNIDTIEALVNDH